jgi:hypothetical protein
LLRGDAVKEEVDRDVPPEKVRAWEEQANAEKYRMGEKRGVLQVGRLGHAARWEKDPVGSRDVKG